MCPVSPPPVRWSQWQKSAAVMCVTHTGMQNRKLESDSPSYWSRQTCALAAQHIFLQELLCVQPSTNPLVNLYARFCVRKSSGSITEIPSRCCRAKSRPWLHSHEPGLAVISQHSPAAAAPMLLYIVTLQLCPLWSIFQNFCVGGVRLSVRCQVYFDSTTTHQRKEYLKTCQCCWSRMCPRV